MAFCLGLEWQWERLGGDKELDQLVQGPQVTKRVALRGQTAGVVLPALPTMKGKGALPGAGALKADAASEALLIKAVVDRAEMPVEVRARGARRFVDGKAVTRIKGQRDTAIGGAGGAIRGQVWQLGAQPTASSNEVRNSADSSSSGASELPRRTVSPVKRPTLMIGTPACPAASIRPSA